MYQFLWRRECSPSLSVISAAFMALGRSWGEQQQSVQPHSGHHQLEKHHNKGKSSQNFSFTRPQWINLMFKLFPQHWPKPQRFNSPKLTSWNISEGSETADAWTHSFPQCWYCSQFQVCFHSGVSFLWLQLWFKINFDHPVRFCWAEILQSPPFLLLDMTYGLLTLPSSQWSRILFPLHISWSHFSPFSCQDLYKQWKAELSADSEAWESPAHRSAQAHWNSSASTSIP